MNINWKLRLQSKSFWIGIIPLFAILLQVVGEPFGLDMAQITGAADWLITVVNIVFSILVFMGVVADPTTEGYSDSKQAMTYTEPKG